MKLRLLKLHLLLVTKQVRSYFTRLAVFYFRSKKIQPSSATAKSGKNKVHKDRMGIM